MNGEPHNGGPAFPLHTGLIEEGMSLRDYFAASEQLTDFDQFETINTELGEALAGRKAPEEGWSTKDPGTLREAILFEADWRAALKYIRADAMLRARERMK